MTKIQYALAGVVMKQLLSGSGTNGSLSLFENRSGGVSKTPIHVHAHDDETIYMLEGSMCAVIAGQEHLIGAGESVFLPRGIPHQLRNDSGEPSHYLLLCTPSGFEGFLQECGHVLAPDERPQPPSAADIERMKIAAPRFGITLLPSWLGE